MVPEPLTSMALISLIATPVAKSRVIHGPRALGNLQTTTVGKVVANPDSEKRLREYHSEKPKTTKKENCRRRPTHVSRGSKPGSHRCDCLTRSHRPEGRNSVVFDC